MNNMKYRVLSLFLTLAMVVGLLPAGALTAHANATDGKYYYLQLAPGDNRLYEDKNGSIEVTNYDVLNTMTSLEVGSADPARDATDIVDSTFYNCMNLQTVTFVGINLASIGGAAFYNCTNLQTVTFTGATPPTIGDNAFDIGAKQLIVYVPQGSEANYRTAFSGNVCGSTTVVINPVAKVGGNYYESWSAAVAAVNTAGTEGQTITLLSDVTMDSNTMPAVACTINGSTDNGTTIHTLTLSGSTDLGADTTLKDIKLSSAYRVICANGHTLTIEGTVTTNNVSINAEGALTVNGNFSCNEIYNGNLTVSANATLTTVSISPSTNAQIVVDGTVVVAGDSFNVDGSVLSGSGTIVLNNSSLTYNAGVSVADNSSLKLKTDNNT